MLDTFQSAFLQSIHPKCLHKQPFSDIFHAGCDWDLFWLVDTQHFLYTLYLQYQFSSKTLHLARIVEELSELVFEQRSSSYSAESLLLPDCTFYRTPEVSITFDI
jgi:hypothetical protein